MVRGGWLPDAVRSCRSAWHAAALVHVGLRLALMGDRRALMFCRLLNLRRLFGKLIRVCDEGLIARSKRLIRRIVNR